MWVEAGLVHKLAPIYREQGETRERASPLQIAYKNQVLISKGIYWQGLSWMTARLIDLDTWMPES